MGKFDDKVAVITGGARGQGRSHARALAREGASVALWDIANGQNERPPYRMASADDLAETVRWSRRTAARRCRSRSTCATVRTSRPRWPRRSRRSAASTSSSPSRARCRSPPRPGTRPRSTGTTSSPSTSRRAFLACKYVVPELIKRGPGGAIVLTSSTAGLTTFPWLTCYGAAKHGVLGLGKGLANELGPYGIRVNMICPGAVDTPMVDSFAEANGLRKEDMWTQFDGADLLERRARPGRGVDHAGGRLPAERRRPLGDGPHDGRRRRGDDQAQRRQRPVLISPRTGR